MGGTVKTLIKDDMGTLQVERDYVLSNLSMYELTNYFVLDGEPYFVYRPKSPSI